MSVYTSLGHDLYSAMRRMRFTFRNASALELHTKLNSCCRLLTKKKAVQMFVSQPSDPRVQVKVHTHWRIGLVAVQMRGIVRDDSVWCLSNLETPYDYV